MHLLRAVAGGDPGPGRGVGVHPLAGRGARQQPQQRVERRPRWARTFSMPTTETSTSGRVRHIRPLPSDSTTTRVPVSATAKLAPETATLRAQELLPQVRARALGERGRVVGEAVGRGAADRGHPSAGRSRGSRRGCGGSPAPGCGWAGRRRAGRSARPGRSPRRRCPRACERLVEADLLGGHRLDLDHLVDAVAPRDLDATIALASAASRAQCTTAPCAVSDSSSSSRCWSRRAARGP